MTVGELRARLDEADNDSEVQIVSDELEEVEIIDHIEIDQVLIPGTFYIITKPIIDMEVK